MRKLSLILILLLLAAALPGFAQEDEPGTIAELVRAATEADEPQFTTLLTALEAADEAVLETLSDPESEITVFAPTDEAFEALREEMGEDEFNALLEDEEALTSLLLYHVIEGAVTAEQAADMEGEEVTTLQGSPVEIRVEDETVFVNDAEVIQPDIEASNGVIHGIDKVLMPPVSVAVATEEATESVVETQEATATQEVTEGAATVEPTEVTTEEATETEESTPEPVATEEATEVAMAATEEAIATETATEEAVATEVATEESTPEAVATGETAPAGNTIVDVVTADTQGNAPQFTTLFSIISGDETLLETLSDPNAQLTVFAPTDEAFAALQETLGEEEYNALLANRGELNNLLLYHAVNGKIFLADITAGFESEENVDALVAQSLLTGETLLITRDEEGNFYVNGAKLITTDIEASNGIIHIIDAVLNPDEEAQQ